MTQSKGVHKTFAFRTRRDNQRVLRHANAVLEQICPENFSDYRSEIYDLGFQLERLEELREAERQRARDAVEKLPTTLGSTLRAAAI